MPIGTTLAIVAASALLGALGADQLHRRADRRAEAVAMAPVEAVKASADVVEATGEAATGAVVAATAEETTDAETRQAVATSEPAPIAVAAAVEVLSPRSVGALAGYLGCIAGSQGKGEGSAAYGCTQRGTALDAALAAEPSVVICTGESCPAGDTP